MHAGAGTGRIIAGRYRLDNAIGRGAMGTVWRAWDEILDREVAVKELRIRDGLAEDERARACQRTRREARTAARLSHPGLVTVYDVAEEDGRPWIIMELVAAPSLDQIISRDGPLPPQRAAQTGRQLLAALATAHAAGVLHRDVKPSNVLLADRSRAVLTDFGIATFQGDPGLTQTGMVMGSPGFTAPERIRGNPATPASDLWSLGATLYAAVEGHGPFEGLGGPITTMTAVINREPPPAPSAGVLTPVISALLRRNPADRPDAATAALMLGSAIPRGEDPYGPGPYALRPSPVRVPAPRGAAPPGQVPAGSAAPADSGPALSPATVMDRSAAVTRQAPPTAPAGAEDPGAPAPPPAPAGAERPGAPGAAGPGERAPGTASPPSFGRPASFAGTEHPAGPASTAGTNPASTNPASTAGSAPFSAVKRGNTVSVARLSPTAGGPNPGSPAGTGGRLARFPRRVVVWAGALALAAVVAAGVMAFRAGREPLPASPGNRAGHPGSLLAAAAAPPSTRPLPAGYRWDKVRPAAPGGTAGFTVAVPGGWAVSSQGAGTFFRAPAGRAYLEIDLTPHTFPGDMLREARYVAGRALAERRLPGYVNLGVAPVRLRGLDAAAWSFSWRDPAAGRIRVLDLMYVARTPAGAQSYALYMSAPRRDWARSLPAFEEEMRTFRPVP